MRCTISIIACLFATTVAQTAETLRVALYTEPTEIIEAYVKRTKETLGRDVTVVVTLVSNNDECFKAIRTGSVDVAVATSNMPKSEKYKAIAGKLISPIAPVEIVGMADLLPQFRKATWLSEGDVVYGVPVNWGMFSLAYNTALVKTAPTSLSAIFGSQSFAVSTDWPECNVALAALAAGIPTEEAFTFDKVNVPAVKAKLAYLAKKSARKWTGVDDADSLKGLEMATVWGDAIPELAKQGETWIRIEPKDFILGYVDNLVIPSTVTSTIRPLAAAFIAEMIRGESQAFFLKRTGAWSVTDKARAYLTPDEAKAAKLDDPDLFSKRLVLLKPLDTRNLNGIARLWEEANR